MSISFYLKKPGKLDRPGVIMMKVYHNQFPNRVCVCSTRERIERRDWRQKKGANGKYQSGWPKKGHESLECRLTEIKLQVTDFIRSHPRDLTREALRSHIFESTEQAAVQKPTSLLEEWSAYLRRIKSGLAPRTYRSYRNSYEAMEMFLKSIDRIDLLPLNFDVKTFQSFRSFLNDRYSHNTVAKKLRHFKMVVNQGMKVGIAGNDIRYKETAGIKIALTEQELRGLIALDLKSGHLSRVRDLFVVQCHTGVRVSDLFRLDKNIQGNFFDFRQTKTDKPVRIPILPTVRKILERYDYRLPKMSQQKYNEGIKKVYKALNEKATMQVRDEEGFKDVAVWELISSHDAVRTFITLSAERGIPVPSIAKVTGKTVSVLLKNYHVDSQMVAERDIVEKWSSGGS